MLVLTYTDESGTEVVVPLATGTVVTIGRNQGSTIRVKNPSVSRNHARIIEADGGWVVQDLGSSNHSYVNDEKVEKGPIASGDQLRFGKCAVVVGEQGDGAAKQASAKRAARPTPVKSAPAKEAAQEPEATEVERKQGLADERERRRAARDARRAARDGSAEVEPPEAPAKRTRPTRKTEPEPEVVEPEVKAQRRKPTRASAVQPDTEEQEVTETDSEAASELDAAEPAPESPASDTEQAQGAEELASAQEARRPTSKPTRDSEMRQRRRGSGERKAAAEARQESVASKRVDPGFDKDLRQAQSRAGEMELALHKAETRVEELQTRIKEVETRDARHEEELDGWHERYNRVREQLSHQGDLLERSKLALSDRDQQFSDSEARVEQLSGDLGALEGGRSETGELISELKARAVQKDRRIDELQRELDLMEFDLRESREEIEGLIDERNVETGDQRRVARETELLREINAEKENVVAELKLELEERSRQLYDAKMGSGIKDLEEARRDVLEQFFEKNREVDELEEKLKSKARETQEARAEIDELEERLVARRDLSSHPDVLRKQRELERAQTDLSDAQESVTRLETRLEEFGPEAKSKLDAEINFLERKNKALQDRMNTLQETLDEGGADSAPPTPEPAQVDTAQLDKLRESATEHLSGTLDDYADWKSNLMLVKTYVEEAREAVDADGDVGAAFESLEELLTVVSSEANGFRRQLVRLKDLMDEA